MLRALDRAFAGLRVAPSSSAIVGRLERAVGSESPEGGPAPDDVAVVVLRTRAPAA